MVSFRKWAGWAALVSAGCYVFAFVWAFAVLVPAGYETSEFEPAEAVAFIADNEAAMFLWTLVIYLLAGAALVPLSLGLHDRLRPGAGPIAQVATAFGLIWATLVVASGMLILIDLAAVADVFATNPLQAETVWITMNAVEEGLGGGIEFPGGMWLLMTSWAALRVGVFRKALNYFGIAIGVFGILTVVPATAEVLTSLFGVSLVVWFAWIGLVLLRSEPTTLAARSDEAAELRDASVA